MGDNPASTQLSERYYIECECNNRVLPDIERAKANLM
jgi:hypothetical protein